MSKKKALIFGMKLAKNPSALAEIGAAFLEFSRSSKSKIDKSKFSKVDRAQMERELELAKKEKARKEERRKIIHEKKISDLLEILDDDAFDILYNFEFIDEYWSREQVLNHFLSVMPSKNVSKLIKIVKSDSYADNRVLYDTLNMIDNFKNNIYTDNYVFRKLDSQSHEQLLSVFLEEISIWNDEYKVNVYNKQELINYFYKNYTGNEVYQLFEEW